MKINWKGDKELMDLVLGWRSDGKTYGEIVAGLTERFGEPVTRNQVAGFLDRNFEGTPIRRVPKKKVEKTKPKADRVVVITKRVPLPQAPRAPRPKGGVTLIDLAFDSCRWPIGDPLTAAFRFCGERRRVCSSYCEEHHGIVYYKQPKRSRAEAKEAHVRTLQLLRINNRQRKDNEGNLADRRA